MSSEPTAALHAVGLHKRFGGVHALRDARLTVGAGEVHALVGANGSGKSTLLGILSGQLIPDSGEVIVGGAPLALGRPAASADAGIAIVTQETTLVPQLSVAENVMLGPVKPRGRFGINWRELRLQASVALERLGLELDSRRLVGSLRPDERQLVEIARAISRSARVLILDEATSSLTEEEVEKLFGVVRSLRDQGVTVITVSHRMSEIFEISDRVTVLRGGLTVAEGETRSMDTDMLVEAMTGRASTASVTGQAPPPRGGTALEVRGVNAHRALSDVSLEVRHGEIVGIAGLMGSGRSELLEMLFGLRERTAGETLLDGRLVHPKSPRDAIDAGIGLVGADRKASGLVMSMSIEQNIAMVATRGASRWRPAGRRRERTQASEHAQSMRIVAPSLNAPVGQLSGGNQQKVVLAKWMQMQPRLLLLDEPTRGVDVAAKLEIYELLRRAREGGTSILLSSSEIPELLAVCDRIVVMARRRVRISLEASQTDETEIVSYATAID